MVWDPQKPKIGPLYPPMDPIWAHFVGILSQFGVKKRVFLKKIYSKSFFIGSQTVWDPQKPKIAPLYPNGPQMTYIGFPDGLGPSKNPKIGLLDPPPHLGTSCRHASRSVSQRAQPYSNPSYIIVPALCPAPPTSLTSLPPSQRFKF